MARPIADQPLSTTLLDLVWRLGNDESLPEDEISRAILDLIEGNDVRLTGTYRDILSLPSRQRTLRGLN